MKLKHAGIAVLVAGYVAAAGLVWRHSHRAAGPERVTIRLCHWQLEGTVRQGLEAVARRYEQLNPRVKVEILVVPETIYRQWMRTQLVGDTAPDLIEYTMYWGRIEELAPRYFQTISREVTEPNPYNRGTPLAGVPWRDTFLDGMTGPDAYNTLMREYYAPTIAMFTMRLFYNRTLLRAITGRDEPPATWREFLALRDAVNAYAQREGRVLSTLSNSRDNNWWLAIPLFQGMGSHFSPRLDHDHSLSVSYWELSLGWLRGEWSFRTPEIANGLAVFREFGNASQPGFVQMRRDVAMLDFLRGHGLILCAGSWDASSLRREAPFEVGAFRLPLPGAEDPEFGPLALGPMSDGSVETSTPSTSTRPRRIPRRRWISCAFSRASKATRSSWTRASGCQRSSRCGPRIFPGGSCRFTTDITGVRDPISTAPERRCPCSSSRRCTGCSGPTGAWRRFRTRWTGTRRTTPTATCGRTCATRAWPSTPMM
jgi:ABC-type glycerol-3-phosphate transport system substrate-binding protein